VAETRGPQQGISASSATSARSDAHRPIHGNYATRKPHFQVLLEPLPELRAALALDKELDALLNFGQRDHAHILRFAIRRFQPTFDAAVA
jgi:hypothetical protein